MRIRANGIEIHYELTGPESAPVVTLSHSLLANFAMWNPQMPALADYRVLRFDTRGHGQSEATPGAYDFELLADDTCALLDAVGIQRTHFVGLSMGGMIGQAVALKYPERIESLILCDTRSHSPPERSKSRAERIAVAQRHGVEPMVEAALEGWFSDGFSTVQSRGDGGSSDHDQVDVGRGTYRLHPRHRHANPHAAAP